MGRAAVRRNKGDKRHKETANAGMTRVKMVLGTVEVAEDAVDVVTGSSAVLYLSADEGYEAYL